MLLQLLDRDQVLLVEMSDLARFIVLKFVQTFLILGLKYLQLCPEGLGLSHLGL